MGDLGIHGGRSDRPFNEMDLCPERQSTQLLQGFYARDSKNPYRHLYRRSKHRFEAVRNDTRSGLSHVRPSTYDEEVHPSGWAFSIENILVKICRSKVLVPVFSSLVYKEYYEPNYCKTKYTYKPPYPR